MQAEDRAAQARFGTFGGVFTPCVLTILGVIMFMRSGFVVGNGGLWQALAILALAKGITGLTTLSLSAIATNTEVKTGGVYFMISRTLGPDFGGTIGLTLFVSQAISIAFYVIGFTEALFVLLSPETVESLAPYNVHQWLSTGVIVLLFVLTFKGADVALKAQYVILGVLFVSICSFFLGGIIAFDSSTLNANLGESSFSPGFWVIFAIFFPAATGITAGANMSGDLKDPGKSIPNGTLAAIGFCAVVYVIQLILLAGFSTNSGLSERPFGTLKDMSLWSPLVVAGVFAATLSSALGSFLGAPRILQAMGKDKLLKPLIYFGKGHGAEDEPRRATVMSLGIAICVVWAGGLDAVAKVISMFFLIAYGMINLSAFVEGKGGNPSFRPRFRLFGWPAALAGALGCAIAMMKIDEVYSLVAMGIAAMIYLWLRGRVGGSFGDAKRGYIFSRTRGNLLALEEMTIDPKNWRPVLAIITEDFRRDTHLIKAASWIESGRGLLSVLEVKDTHQGLSNRIDSRHKSVAELREFLSEHKVVAFADSVVVPNALQQLDTIIQAYSIGSLRPNTVMISVPPPSQVERRKRVALTLKILSEFGLNIVVYKGGRPRTEKGKTIDLWWHGQRNGSLLTLFAYLTSTHKSWKKTKIRMMRVVSNEEERKEAERNLRDIMQAARLRVNIEVIVSTNPVTKVIEEHSKDSGLVFLGMAQKDVATFDEYLESRNSFLMAMPPTLLVLSNGEADLLA